MEKKNRKKKVFVSIFLLSCTLLFAGCGKKQSEYEEQETSQTEESEAIITVGFAQSGSGATWNAANIDSIKQNCSEEMTVLTIRLPQFVLLLNRMWMLLDLVHWFRMDGMTFCVRRRQRESR